MVFNNRTSMNFRVLPMVSLVILWTQSSGHVVRLADEQMRSPQTRIFLWSNIVNQMANSGLLQQKMQNFYVNETWEATKLNAWRGRAVQIRVGKREAQRFNNINQKLNIKAGVTYQYPVIGKAIGHNYTLVITC